MPPGDPIRTSPGVLLSAHRAGGLDSALKRIGAMTIDDLELVLRGLPPMRLQSAQPETVAIQRSKPGIAVAALSGPGPGRRNRRSTPKAVT